LGSKVIKIHIGRKTNMMYYEMLETVDKEIEEIHDWQKAELEKLYAETEVKINNALAKLGPHMPEEIKRNGSR
jgi:hypothetical protein